MKQYPVTVHMIVKNEERFVEFALGSVVPFIDHFIIYDTGSDDTTVEIIKHFIQSNRNKDIHFEQIPIKSPTEITSLRLSQIAKN